MQLEEKGKWKEQIKKEVMQCMDLSKEVTDEHIREVIDERIIAIGKKQYLSLYDRKRLQVEIFNSIRKLDVIQEFLEDDTITEIMVNGENHIFIERQGKLEEVEEKFESRQKLEDVIQQIAAKSNRMVNEASPIVDTRLEDGSRVNIVLPPIALNGPIVTIRKFPKRPITMEKLIELGAVTQEVATFLKKLVAAKYNIFISGGTGAGKTTFLNALSCFIPADERIITIEDSAELQLSSATNLVRLEMRMANMEGKNQVSIRDLIKSALRMRPDRIILGEVRDAAALDLLTAYNSGHDGSLSTGHANSSADMLARLETLVLLAADIPLSAIRKQIASALDIMIHLGRMPDKSRKVLEIVEILDCNDGEIELNPLYQFRVNGENADGTLRGNLEQTGNGLLQLAKLRMAGISI